MAVGVSCKETLASGDERWAFERALPPYRCILMCSHSTWLLFPAVVVENGNEFEPFLAHALARTLDVATDYADAHQRASDTGPSSWLANRNRAEHLLTLPFQLLDVSITM